MYFLTIDDVMAIHTEVLATYGGSEGVRDQGLLISALTTPQATFGGDYLHPTIYDKAAAYLFHLARNHAFIDGNKRTAWQAAVVFLELNDVDLAVDYDLDEIECFVIDAATGKLDKAEIATYLRKLFGRAA
ncbi:MAG: type II toxin-antitoxin system death-on-curing family toxin [Planctomycetes bacterium]|nr:type II toxin-antitoxin system death-on-curing family toxin [Planctomycetota bacterium]